VNRDRQIQLLTGAPRRSNFYAKAGRFTEAVDTAEHALAVARRNGQKALLNALPSRLTQYRAGQPVRERPGDKHQ
jgi:hypothetical protein